MHTLKHGYQYVTSRESRLQLAVSPNRLQLIVQSIAKMLGLMVQHSKNSQRKGLLMRLLNGLWQMIKYIFD